MDKRLFPELARQLDQSEKSRQQIRQFSLEYPDITIEDAYAIQQEWLAMKVAAGRPAPMVSTACTKA